MVDDGFSCIKEVTKTVHIALPTACTSNEISGICDVLESWKRQYIQQLQGIVVSYKNVSLSSVRGYIKLDCPVVHYDVKATFELFYPTAGSILKGKINRISHDHIGCLVHNTINVTIDYPNDLIGDISKFIVLDRMILFQITRLDFKRKVIRVRGKITQECIDIMKESSDFCPQNDNLGCTSSDFNVVVGNRKIYGETSNVSNNIEGEKYSSDSTLDNSPKKKKRKKSQSTSPEKKFNVSDIGQDSSLVSESSTDISSHINSSKKKKKHQKSKNDVFSSPPLFNESLESDVNEIKPTQHQQNEFSVTSLMSNLNSVTVLPDTISSQVNSAQEKTLEDINNMLENSLLDFKTKDPISTLLVSPSKNKKTKKSKKSSSSSKKEKDKSSKKKHKKSKSDTHKKHVKNEINSPLDIKEEIHSDSSSSVSPKSKENFKDVYQMMEAFSSFEPPPEAQLLGDTLSPKVKKEPTDSPKKGKKRKRDSVDAGSLPKKKQKKNDGSSPSKSKIKTQKKKKKDKSKKDSKKDKKKKTKNKVISSKKKGHGYKVKLKKKNKEKKPKDKVKKEIKSEP